MDGSQTCFNGWERSDAMGKGSCCKCFCWGQSKSVLIAAPWAAVAVVRAKIALWGCRHVIDGILIFSSY